MRWIGLTGPMGSGKSTVADLLRNLGFPVLDADRTVHLILSPGGPAEARIFQVFGDQVRGADGHLDRPALGRLVFGNAGRLAQLEQILHPLVRERVSAERQRLVDSGAPAAFYDVPLLFEKKMEADFDAILVVHAREDIRQRRWSARSRLTEAEFLERSRHHVSAEEKVARASAVIENNGGIEELKLKLGAALAQLGLPTPANS